MSDDLVTLICSLVGTVSGCEEWVQTGCCAADVEGLLWDFLMNMRPSENEDCFPGSFLFDFSCSFAKQFKVEKMTRGSCSHVAV